MLDLKSCGEEFRCYLKFSRKLWRKQERNLIWFSFLKKSLYSNFILRQNYPDYRPASGKAIAFQEILTRKTEHGFWNFSFLSFSGVSIQQMLLLNWFPFPLYLCYQSSGFVRWQYMPTSQTPLWVALGGLRHNYSQSGIRKHVKNPGKVLTFLMEGYRHNWLTQRWSQSTDPSCYPSMTSVRMKDTIVRMKEWEERSSLGLYGFSEQLNQCQQSPDFLLCRNKETLLVQTAITQAFCWLQPKHSQLMSITEGKWELISLVIAQNIRQIIKILKTPVYI